MGLWELIAIIVVVQAVASIVKARHGGGKGTISAGELDEIHRRMDDQADLLAEAQVKIEDQHLQLEELQERLEFAERLLSRARDLPELGAGRDKLGDG